MLKTFKHYEEEVELSVKEQQSPLQQDKKKKKLRDDRLESLSKLLT